MPTEPEKRVLHDPEGELELAILWAFGVKEDNRSNLSFVFFGQMANSNLSAIVKVSQLIIGFGL